MARSSRVTLDTISRELNLSTSSVSRALRNDPLVHPETRAQVNATAMRLGYQGRSRRGPQVTSRQRTIGVLFAANSMTDVKSHSLTMSYLQGLTSEAGPANVTLNIHAAEEFGLNGVPPEHLDTDVWVLSGQHTPERVAKLASVAPVVSFVRAYPGVTHDLVATDDLSGISQLVARLAALGHRRCVWASFDAQGSFVRARLAGFLEGVAAAGLDLSKQTLLDNIFSDGKLSRPEPLLAAIRAGATAVMAVSDHAAYEVGEALAKAGYDVPGDVSLTGFDAIGEPGLRAAQYTSFDPNFVEMGRSGARLALWRLENPSAASVQLTVRGSLLEGSTTAAPRGAKAARRKAGR
jgi:DNA-binding LacI/PurR family transcriptional regulator